jgi:hypothetical protein
VAPSFRQDGGLELPEMNGVLQSHTPIKDPPQLYHRWMCTSTHPVVLTVDNFTSAGEFQTDKLLRDGFFKFPQP